MINFGWSVGDIAAAINILVKISKGLQETGGAASQFQQVVQDFEALKLVLEFIEDLNDNDAEFHIATALCSRSQSSQHVLGDFLAGVAKYETSLGYDPGSIWHHGVFRKTQWVLLMTKEVRKLQEALEPQMQSVNLLLHALQM